MKWQTIAKRAIKQTAKNHQKKQLLGKPVGEATINGYRRLVYQNRDGELSYEQSNGRRYLVNPSKVYVEYYTNEVANTSNDDVVKTSNSYIASSNYKRKSVDKNSFLILTIVLGWFGVNFMVNNRIGTGILYLVLSITGITIPLTIWDIINIARMSDEEYLAKYSR